MMPNDTRVCTTASAMVYRALLAGPKHYPARCNSSIEGNLFMSRPRVSLGLEASRPTLNGPLCAELGRQLAAAREVKGLTIEQAAAQLLLTPRQVHALETVVAEAFYGADFYGIALRKYTVLLGLDAGLASQALVPPKS